MAIDPGKTSGYVYAELTPNKGCSFYPFQMFDDVEDLWKRLHIFKPEIIVMEDFEVRRSTPTGVILFPVQLIGVARLYVELTPPPVAIHLQKAAQGKAFYKDPVLKQHNLYKRGIPHGMDATRHLLQWVTFGAGFKYNNTKKTGEFFTLLNKWV